MTINESEATELLHFKMEGIFCLSNLLKTGDWMDLKDAYFMIPIQEQDQLFQFQSPNPDIGAWWDHMTSWNGKAERPSLIIESDASRRGWTESDLQWNQDRWVVVKQRITISHQHVAAFHAIKCFAKDSRGITILLNIAYVNSTVSRQGSERNVVLVPKQGYFANGGASVWGP